MPRGRHRRRRAALRPDPASPLASIRYDAIRLGTNDHAVPTS
jgi:hypothetical protein